MLNILTLVAGRFSDAAGVAVCKPNDAFLGIIPKWYKYLEVTEDQFHHCVVKVGISTGGSGFNNLLLIGLAIVDGLLRIGGIVAVGFVIYGGFQYMTSQGEPDKTTNARHTITNALIGLFIALFAIPIVSFIGNRIGG